MSSRTGSCVCGEVQIEVQGEPEVVVMCHCSDCSKNAGSPYQLSAKFPKSNVKVTKGEESIGTYTSNKTTSGKPKDKVFTKCCGCTLWTIPMLLGGNNYIIRTAILENGLKDFKPSAELFTKFRPAYLEPAHDTAQVEGYPV